MTQSLDILKQLQQISALGDSHVAGRASNGYVNTPRMNVTDRIHVETVMRTGKEGEGQVKIHGPGWRATMLVYRAGSQWLSWNCYDMNETPLPYIGVFQANRDMVVGMGAAPNPEDLVQIVLGGRQMPEPSPEIGTKVKEQCSEPTFGNLLVAIARGAGKERLVIYSEFAKRRHQLLQALGFQPIEDCRIEAWERACG